MSENPAIHRLSSGDVDIALPEPEKRAVVEGEEQPPTPPAQGPANMVAPEELGGE